MEPIFKEHLGLALLELYKADRYLYNVAARLRIEKGDIIPSMPEVRGYTDGVKIYFTEPWIKATQEERLTTLTHEVLHVISKHLVRIRNVPNINHMRMNVAADLSIMGQQLELNQKPPIAQIIPDAKKYLNMDMFEIYELLSDEDGNSDLGHPQIGDVNGEGDTPFDLAPASSEDEFDVDVAIQQAAVQAEAEGYSTAASRAANRQVNEMRAKPIRWDYYLAQVASRLKSELPTWARPNRRLMSQVYLPSRRNKEVFEATVAMDVSGSVGEQPLNQIAAITQEIITKYVDKMHLMTFDDKIVDEWHLSRKDKIVDLQLNGYGGTYVQKVYDHLKENKQKPKVLIIATDGYIPKTEDPGYKVIWLIVNNPKFQSPYGTVLHVNTKEL